jgi:signal transduction histidine kinase
MLKNILQNKILLSVVLVSIFIVSTLFFFIPHVTEKITVDTVAKNSINTVEQMKLARAYYVSSVVKDVQKYAPNITFDYNHEGVNGKLPFPTTTIHNLSTIFSDNTKIKFNLYSEYPFKPKENRILSDKQKEILKFTKENKDGIYIGQDIIDGVPVLRVAITDFMTDPSCVSCHNSHKDKTWENEKWKLGDKRGVLEIITPLDDAFAANQSMRNQILVFITIAMLLLIFYYSYMLSKREMELLDKNEMLDAKVKSEVEKNIQKEKQLVIQNRSAALGDMMAAIIHQWKQPLSSISMSNGALKLHNELGTLDKDELINQTANTDKQLDNMTSTMDDFRNFFKPQKEACYDVNESIGEVIKIVGKIYEIDNIKIITKFESDVITSGYSNELTQVMINILNNARDAIVENNPTIKHIYITTYKHNNGCTITIKDLAGGIPNDIIEDIFQPYVTTKSEDKGTGIGLDMSKTIIEKVHGTIEAKNIKDTIDNITYSGAMFVISLKGC